MATVQGLAFLDPSTNPRRVNLASLFLLNLVIGAAYALTGYAGLKLAFVGHAATLFWPPSGIAFAALWLGGVRLAPAILAASFILNLTVFGSPLPAFMVAFGNLAPLLVGRATLKSILRRWPAPGELPTVLAFILVACLGATAFSASVGALAVRFSAAPQANIASTWVVWWMGDAMGVLIAAPPLLLARRLASAKPDWPVLSEASAFGVMALSTVAGLLLIRQPLWALELCKLCTFLLSLWAGARFGLLGPASVSVVMAMGSVWATSLGVGPFARGDFYDRFVLVHSYLFAEAAAGLLFAAALEDRQRSLDRERTARDAVQGVFANRMTLLNMLNHDVRTPLSGIMGVLQSLSAAPLSPDQHAQVSLGLRAGSSLTNLVNNLLDVTRVDAGRIQLQEAPFSPEELVTDMVDLIRPRADRKALTLTLEIEPGLPSAILGDRTRLEQVLGNLLTNAIAYTEKGEVRVCAAWRTPPGALFLDVYDTGPGLKNGFGGDVLTVQGALTEQSSAGLGLGLHICRQLVDLMGGEMTYEGGPGLGSHFRVTAPFAEAQAISADRAPPAVGPAKILLVEDDEIAREASQAFLESLGHRVIAADNASRSLELARTQRFDLILLDIHLGAGEMSGLDLARAVRRMPAPAGLVILIALTGDGDEALAQTARAAGVDEVWVKPLDLSKISQLLRSRRPEALGDGEFQSAKT